MLNIAVLWWIGQPKIRFILKVLVALCIDRSKKYQKIQNSVLHAFGCRAKFHHLC
jgi:hypothetical protein